MPTVRYEGTFNILVTPFEVGTRHLKLAFSPGTPDKLTALAVERVIYRPNQGSNFNHLSLSQRVIHCITGLLETVGYLTLILPYIILIVDRILNKPTYLKGSPQFQTHMEEGGRHGDNMSFWRLNPFHPNGNQDPFYRNASWAS